MVLRSFERRRGGGGGGGEREERGRGLSLKGKKCPMYVVSEEKYTCWIFYSM